MAVTSEPIKQRAKGSAIITRAQLDRQRSTAERSFALGILFASFFGTCAAFSGGITAMLTGPQPAPIIAGIGSQVILTAVEWWYAHGRGKWRYRLAMAADTALTALGLGPLVVDQLAAYIARYALPIDATYLAWAMLAVASFLIAWFPETTLVE